jgi:hypothetical protein
MKKQFYLVLFFFSVALCSQAQIKKGTILLGGDVGFSSQKNENDDPNNVSTKQTIINLAPSIGKAIKDNLVAGVDLTFGSVKSNQYGGSSSGQNTYTNNQHDYGLGFFLRRYKPLGSGFSVFMQGRLGAIYNTQKSEITSQLSSTLDLKGYTIDLGFYPGISYAITKRIQLETGFQNLVYAQYDHSKSTQVTNSSPGTNSVTNKSNDFRLATSLSDNLYGFVVGFRVLLGS